VWWLGQRGLVDKIKKTQNDALRSIMGAFRSTPIAALEAEAAIPPTETRLNHNIRRYALRIATLPEDHPIRLRCPTDYPPGYATGRDEEMIHGRPWHRQEDTGRLKPDWTVFSTQCANGLLLQHPLKPSILQKTNPGEHHQSILRYVLSARTKPQMLTNSFYTISSNPQGT